MMDSRAVPIILLVLVVLAAQPLGAGYVSLYQLKIVYIAEGSGAIKEEIFSKTFILAPTIKGWQRLVNYSLYIDGRRVDATIKRDNQGNRYLFPEGDIKFNGRINITLIEYIEVIPPPQRETKLPPNNCQRAIGTPDRYLYLGGFWGHAFGGVTLDDLKRLAGLLGGDGTAYAYRVISWIITNTRYQLGVRGGVAYPTEFYKEKRGACGDIHSFLVTMLRIKGIPSYLYYAYIFGENASMRLSGEKASYETVNALPHMFAMAMMCGREFPIDVTYPTARDPFSAIRGAGVNTGDRVIVIAKIIDADPNDYLLVYAPSNNSAVHLKVELRKSISYRGGGGQTPLALATLVLIAILAVAALLKPAPTVWTDNV